MSSSFFVDVYAPTWFSLSLSFYSLLLDSSYVIGMITLSPERGVSTLDGT